MSAFLPQYDPNRDGRAEQLQAAQKTYQYNYTYVSPLAVVERVPFQDEFSFHWIKTVAEQVVTSLANRAEVDVGEHHCGYHHAKHGFLRSLMAAGPALIHGV